MTEQQRQAQITTWLDRILAGTRYELAPASADASFRSYLRISLEGQTLILMDAPPEQEDCGPFLDINQRLASCALNVPVVLASDLEQGFILMSDLGNEHFLQVLNPSTVGNLYADAIAALIHMQRKVDTRGLPAYDHALFWREMLLFRDWLVETHLGIKLSAQQLGMLETVFEWLAESALQQPKVFVHRDFHSRNLMYTNPQNPGVLDYQDAVYGPLTYDLASLLKDCYIQWPRELMTRFAQAYYEQACELGLLEDIDEKRFLRDFDLMGVQRHLKASGIFARLWHRDGKQGYLADIPRTLNYIVQLEGDYPELQALIDLIKLQILPGLKETTETQ